MSAVERGFLLMPKIVDFIGRSVSLDFNRLTGWLLSYSSNDLKRLPSCVMFSASSLKFSSMLKSFFKKSRLSFGECVRNAMKIVMID